MERGRAEIALLPSFTVGPGLKFLQAKDFAMLLNLPCTVGWNLKKGTYFGISVPVMLNFNFGSAAGNNENAKFGIGLGAGAGYTNIVNYYEESLNKRAHTEFWGYHFIVAVSFKPDKDDKIVPSLLFSFGKSFIPDGGYVAGVGFCVGLGMNN